ncbi:hypothetical protein B5807_10240 [Epicoccum nigrum]|uniref:Pet127-domain-containing protein n=1 Tax=Epicoccum nigrum TaxID=105696 RepID=A0A1Y2LN44_EPING|nr:hypothetical protein B5807_10240 [Epicoccum nigrum]
MLRNSSAISQAAPWRAISTASICCFCAARSKLSTFQLRPFSATDSLQKRHKSSKKASKNIKHDPAVEIRFFGSDTPPTGQYVLEAASRNPNTKKRDNFRVKLEAILKNEQLQEEASKEPVAKRKREAKKLAEGEDENRPPVIMSLKDALLGTVKKDKAVDLKIEYATPEDYAFEPVEVDLPAVPMLAYGLDRVLFNPGVYLLQDPRTGVYNFDPYLEKIMPVEEFDFDALSEYKTSSKDEDLLAITRRLGIKYTGSTSSMSSVLQHFHFLLSAHRRLDHSMLSRNFPDPNNRFSRVTAGPDAVFLRYKNGVYAIDADKTYDTPNVMSWLGHSMEKLLTTERSEFERYRRSSSEESPDEGDSARCFHYSRQGSVLMRSQLDAHDPRLPGAGIFDLKTRAVVSIRMNHKEYEQGLGYQLRYAQGEWESFEREFYDMTRATMLKYSLQVRMGRMDGIFVAYHNIERIFGFQYLSLAEMDQVLHGQSDTCLGDQEFKMSIGLMEEIMNRATEKFPETTIRFHIETRDTKQPFMYVFAEPVSEERADEIQSTGAQYAKEWARRVIGVGKDDAEAQESWQNVQGEVDEQVSEDGAAGKEVESVALREEAEISAENEAVAEGESTVESQLSSEQPEDEAEEAKEDVESKSEVEAETSIENDAENEVETEAATEAEIASEEYAFAPPRFEKETTSSGPLVGWTVTIRNKVNGQYVARPELLEPEDNWQIEYNVREIAEANVWKLYNATKERRRQLVGLNDDEVDSSLQNYRKVIQRYASRGRTWRAQQDQLEEQRGVHVFKPLGPGSEEHAEKPGSEPAGESNE